MLPFSLFPMMLCTFPMLLCTFPMLLCTFLVQLHRPRPAASSSTMPPHRRSPSGKLFRTDCRFAPSLRNAPASCFRWLPVPAAPPRHPGQLLPPAVRTSSSATAPLPAAALPRRPLLGIPLHQCPGQQRLPDSSLPHCPWPAPPPRRPGQQQASSGREKYSDLASNLAHLGRIC